MKRPRRNRKTGKGSGKANHAKLLEACTEQIFQHGFAALAAKDFIRLRQNNALPSRYFVTQYPYRHLYGWMGKKDTFVWDNSEGWMIECKFQGGEGTKYEGFYIVWASFLDSEIPNWIFIYDGDWWTTRSGCLTLSFFKQLERKAPQGKRFLVLSRKEFRDFVRQQWGGQVETTEHASAVRAGDLFSCTD